HRTALHVLRERPACDVLQNQTPIPREFLHIVDCGDIRMVQGSQQPSLALRSDKTLAILTEFLGQDFDGDVSAESRVASPIYDAHSSCADDGLNFVLIYNAADPRIVVVGSHIRFQLSTS